MCKRIGLPNSADTSIGNTNLPIIHQYQDTPLKTQLHQFIMSRQVSKIKSTGKYRPLRFYSVVNIVA